MKIKHSHPFSHNRWDQFQRSRVDKTVFGESQGYPYLADNYVHSFGMSLQHSHMTDNRGKFPFHMRGGTQGPTVSRCPQVYRHNPGLFFLKSMVPCSPIVSLQVAWRPQPCCSSLSSPFKESSFHWSPLQACFLWVRADPWVGGILCRAFLKDNISCGFDRSPSVSNWCHLEFLVLAQSKGSSPTEGEEKEVIWELPKQTYTEIPGSWAAHPNLG